MSLYETMQSVRDASLLEAVVLVMLANTAMFLVALAAGNVLTKRFGRFRAAPPPPPVTSIEVVLATACVLINGLVAVAGVVLWREGQIHLRPYGDYGVITVALDAGVLFLAMDFAMYVFHRVAHLPLLYPIAHTTHHRYDKPRPLTLFVLSPIEVLGFGILWLAVLLLYTSSIEGILIYLSLNLSFGLVGHLGVEPAPARWVRLPVLKYVSTSTFHAEHHLDREHNFGFYLLVWDRLFGTLSPAYDADFLRATNGRLDGVPPALTSP